MSELHNTDVSDGSAVPLIRKNESPGRLLRAARESAGVHIAALAGALKISVSKLEALESDNFAALPDAVFARALASSVCRILHLDPVSVLALMPKGEGPNFSTSSSDINTTFKDTSRKIGRSSLFEQATRPISIVVILLLLGVLALLFLPFGSDSPIITAAGNKVTIDAPAKPLAVPAEISNINSNSATVLENNAEEVALPQVTTSTSEVSTDAAVPEAVEVTVPVKILEFKALGESWVQVRDATKTVIFERTLAKGETASTAGALPLTVVIGRADVTEVFIHGKNFALAGVAKENVARFEVKQ